MTGVHPPGAAQVDYQINQGKIFISGSFAMSETVEAIFRKDGVNLNGEVYFRINNVQ